MSANPTSGVTTSAFTGRHAQPEPGPPGDSETRERTSRPKLRRRPLLIAAAVVLIAVGALTAAWLTTVVGHTASVVAVRETVPRGAQITRQSLMTVSISPDPGLRTVPASDLDSIVGKYATSDLPAGGILPADAYTATNALPAGQSLVGVSVTPAQAPSQSLSSGDRIKLVVTPRTQDDPPTVTPSSINAVIVSSRPVGDQGQVILDVSVPQDQAALLAATAATGRIAVILDGSGG